MSTFAGSAVRVHDDAGSHVEPPIDDAWSDLDKLRWWAAVAATDEGLRIAVSNAEIRRFVESPRGLWDRLRRRRHGAWVTAPGYYTISVGSSFNSSYTFAEAWVFLTGVSIGAQQRAKAS